MKTCQQSNMKNEITMPAKRPNLAANVKAAAGDAPALSAPPMQRMPAPANVTRSSDAKRSPSREGRKAVYAWVDPALHKQLKRLSLETGRSIDALVTEGVELLVKNTPI